MRFNKHFVLVLTGCLVLATLKGCHCESSGGNDDDDDTELTDCLTLKELLTSEVTPAGVRTVFQLLDCEGYPISDLTNSELEILLDGEEIRTEGDVAPVLTQEVDFEQYSLLLLDMSDSIVDSGSLPPMVNAARTLVHKLLIQGSNVAIYRFAGPKYFNEVQDFTADQTALDKALDDLSLSDGLGTTDLYGSIPRAINILDMAGSIDMLTTRTMVLFTDGSDEAMASTSKAAQYAIDNTDSQVFTVGLGGDVNQDELVAFGKNGFEWAEYADKLDVAFDSVTKQIHDLARSHYMVGVCSPRTGSIRQMTLVINRDGDSGSLTVNYDASDFDIVGCDVNQVAYPCKDKQCGYVDSFSCGSCLGTNYCTDKNTCEDACQDAECGDVHGIDCGSCSDIGDTFTCDENSCVDACEDAECGPVLGIDCGDCSDMGDTFSCDQHACIDACEDAECGTILGINCGDCSSQGEDYGCDANHTCVEACSEIECGTVLGIDCGTCSDMGDTFGCDAENTCVDACEDAECGTVLGVDCGDCASGFECSTNGACTPKSLPGMQWVFIPETELTLGCDMVADPACALDEARRKVSLSKFWIMDTEVTVGMYETCVSDGSCNSSNVGTLPECNIGHNDNQPLNCVSWDGLKQFCEYMGGSLPTESQWEFAYRGLHDDDLESYWIYPWGNSPAPNCTKVVMNEGGPGCGNGGTEQVGSKPVTSFDIKNMAGNVGEWTLDFYASTFKSCGDEACIDPSGPVEGEDRVVRGGAFDDFYASAFRTAKRYDENPTTRSPSIGGRCVK
jgi:formylglycine-generating enzyme required for sulfatase activity